MNKKNIVILSAIVFYLAVYLVDALIFYHYSNEDLTFLEVLITGIPPHEVFKRIIFAFLVAIFAFALFEQLNRIIIETNVSKMKSQIHKSGAFDSDFLSNLTYQIRIPLTAIAGFADLLKDPDISPELRNLYIRHIRSNSNFMLLLIKNISDLAIIESGRFEIAHKECEVNKLMNSLYQELEMKKKESEKDTLRIVLKNDVKAGDFPILTDPVRLKQILENLLENAFGYSSDGLIEFGYNTISDRMLEFFVRNSGQGMTVEQMDAIFKKFNKLSDTQNFAFNDVVLRLAISKSIVKLLKGDIHVDQGPGNFTSLIFRIPFIPVERKTEVSIKNESNVNISIDWSDRIILVAEDVASNFYYLREVVKPTKVNILWAKNGLEAVEFIKKNEKIDLVLMDILMPEMDGYDASREIRQLNQTVPIIAQTAFLFEDNDDPEKIKYFSEYLIKPVWAPQLIELLKKYFI